MLVGYLSKRRLCHHTEHFVEHLKVELESGLFSRLATHVSGSHSRELGVGVISRSNLDDIRGHDVQTVEPAKDGPQLARRPSSRLRRTCGRRERGVNGVNLHTPYQSPPLRTHANGAKRTSIER